MRFLGEIPFLEIHCLHSLIVKLRGHKSVSYLNVFISADAAAVCTVWDLQHRLPMGPWDV